MDTTLKRLEARLDELVTAYRTAGERVRELEARVAELEAQLADSGTASERVGELEREREELTARLEKVLSLVDVALSDSNDEG